jgi:hypothetical protein
MKIKKQLWQEIESSSDELLSKTLDFLKYLKTQETIETKAKTTNCLDRKIVIRTFKNLK